MKEGVLMAISEAQKKASNKWNLNNMSTLACKVKKEQAEQFKAYAKEQGKTTNTLLKDYVEECIKDKQ